MSECIHGLEVPLCDICYPKAPPERPAPARATRPASTRAPRAATVTTSRRSIDPAQQRVYHVTHLRNLEAILSTGALEAMATPVVDLSSPLTRELRLTAETPAGTSVAEYVPFYLTPSALVWDDLRRGAADETRWSAAARAAASGDLVVLVTTVAALGEGALVADGDAAGSVTRFSGGDDIVRALTRLHDSERLDEAEVLALGSVAFDTIQLLGVANDPVRERVRAVLGSGVRTKVAVYPPWFQAAD